MKINTKEETYLNKIRISKEIKIMWFEICDFLKEYKKKKQTKFITSVCDLVEDYYGGLYTDEEFIDEIKRIHNKFK